MTITLKQIADLHIDKWAGGMQTHDTQDYRRSTILKIRGICNGLLKIDILNMRNDGDKKGSGTALAEYERPVTKEGGVASATLPEFPISIAHDGGIHRVFPKDRAQGGYDFERTYDPGVSIKTRSGNYYGSKKYWIVGNKINFRGAYVEPDEDMNVIIQMFVAAPDTIGEDAALPIPPEYVEEILRRLDIMKQPVMPADKVNNNNPNL
jgi:hypothetical protein